MGSPEEQIADLSQRLATLERVVIALRADAMPMPGPGNTSYRRLAANPIDARRIMALSSPMLVAGAGLLNTAYTWSIDLATNPGLEMDAGGDAGKLRVKVKNASGTTLPLTRDADGLYSIVYANGGLTYDGVNGLTIVLDTCATTATAAASLSVTGLRINVERGTALGNIPMWDNDGTYTTQGVAANNYAGGEFDFLAKTKGSDQLGHFPVPNPGNGLTYFLKMINGVPFWEEL